MISCHNKPCCLLHFFTTLPKLVFFFFLCTIFIPTIQPLSFTIDNFNDTESASLVGYAGEARVENRTIALNSITTKNSPTGVSVGRAIYGQPLRLKNSSNGVVTDFSTRFSFSIDVFSKTTYGDGFAFYVAPLEYLIPSSTADNGSTLGLYGGDTQYNIIAVEFDTYVNDFDPPMQHVGINNNSVVSMAYAKFDIETNLGNMAHALITYNASTKLFAVSWFFDGTTNSSLSLFIDLAEILPEWVNVGFSGATGSSKEENVIHSWEFSSSLNLSSINPQENKENNDTVVKYKIQGKFLVIVVTCFVVLVVVFLGVISWLIIKNRSRNEDGFDLDKAAMPRRFGYNELVSATNGFADDRRLGEGGSGQVYKGFLSDEGRVVAVKRIFSDVEDSERVFRNEVKIISRLMHRNLVQFMGWCHEKGELMLVFEYMVNGSLDTHLFGNRRNLTWTVRYNIALGVARALHYLHEDAEQCVLHRDIKSGNVLLDTDFNTKISDFGIAKLVDPRLRTQKTRVVGTYGYLAPEYINEGRVSKESDMYGFGVVALEIACGRKTYLQDEEYNHVPLTNWVWKHYKEGNILGAADEGLNLDFDVNEMTCLLTVGLWCTNQDHRKRPKAEQVITVLKQEAPLPLLSI